MLLSWVEAGTPFDLLRRENYHEYWRLRCQPKQLIPHPDHSYLASVWQIQSVIFQVILLRLFGVNRCTRYIWAFTSSGMFWLDLAERLLDTARNLFGCDGMEILNDKIKSTMRMNSGKFGSRASDLITLIRVLRWNLWDHINFRESNPHVDTVNAQKSSLLKQSKRDAKRVAAGDKLRDFFARNKVSYIPPGQYLIANVHKYDLSHKLHVTEDHVQDLTELVDHGPDYFNENEDEDELSNRVLQNGFELNNRRLNGDDDTDSDSEDENEPQTFDTNDVEDIFTRIGSGHFRVNRPNYHEDHVGKWKSLCVDRNKERRLYLGAREIVISGHFQDARHIIHHLRFEWSYKQLFAIYFHIATDRNAVYLKFTEMPIIKQKTPELPQWVRCTSIPCPAAQQLSNNGLVRVDVGDSIAVTTALQNTEQSHPAIRLSQLKSLVDFTRLERGFSDAEKKHAAALFEKSSYPINGLHSVLAEELHNHFLDTQKGRRGKKCANCGHDVQAYATHAMCVKPEDETRNVASCLLARLGCERNPVQPAQFVVEETADPADHSHELSVMSAAQQVIESCPMLWVPFILSVYARSLGFLMKHRKTVMRRCRRTNNWTDLNLRPSWLFTFMDAAMRETLDTLDHQYKVSYQDRGSFVKDMFRAVSGIWKISEEYYSLTFDEPSSQTGPLMCRHYRQRIHWNTRLNHSEFQYCNDEQFAQWGVEVSSIVLNSYQRPTDDADRWKYHFWDKLDEHLQ